MSVVEGAATRSPSADAGGEASDRRGSPLPTLAMVTTRLMELRRRRGLMIALVAVTVGLPTVVLAVRLVLHAVAPHTYGPAGGYDVFTALTVGVLYTFGFIVAATLGCTAGSVDLAEGMFRHLVVTGRSRVALYLARIPAGLAIVVPLVALGFTIVCAVCVFAAPRDLDYDGAHVPAGLSVTQFEAFAAAHPTEVICDFPYDRINIAAPCRGSGRVAPAGAPDTTVVIGRSGSPTPATPGQIRSAVTQIARATYPDYRRQFRVPSTSLMVKTGLWLELEAAIGLLVGLGLSSLIGQLTVAIVLMIVLEVVLTPIVLRVKLPHLVNLQRSVAGAATAHLEPGQLPLVFGGGGGDYRVTESTAVAVVVLLAWVLVWTALGAWRMATRDA